MKWVIKSDKEGYYAGIVLEMECGRFDFTNHIEYAKLYETEKEAVEEIKQHEFDKYLGCYAVSVVVKIEEQGE